MIHKRSHKVKVKRLISAQQLGNTLELASDEQALKHAKDKSCDGFQSTSSPRLDLLQEEMPYIRARKKAHLGKLLRVRILSIMRQQSCGQISRSVEPALNTNPFTFVMAATHSHSPIHPGAQGGGRWYNLLPGPSFGLSAKNNWTT